MGIDAKAGTTGIRPPEVVKREFVEGWLARAEEDLGAAKLLNGPPARSGATAAYHAAQAAEAYLRALFTEHQIDFYKARDVRQLLELTTQLPEPLEVQSGNVGTLSRYDLDSLYPGGPAPATREEAQRAIELAGQVRDAVLEALGRFP